MKTQQINQTLELLNTEENLRAYLQMSKLEEAYERRECFTETKTEQQSLVHKWWDEAVTFDLYDFLVPQYKKLKGGGYVGLIAAGSWINGKGTGDNQKFWKEWERLAEQDSRKRKSIDEEVEREINDTINRTQVIAGMNNWLGEIRDLSPRLYNEGLTENCLYHSRTNKKLNQYYYDNFRRIELPKQMIEGILEKPIKKVVIEFLELDKIGYINMLDETLRKKRELEDMEWGSASQRCARLNSPLYKSPHFFYRRVNDGDVRCLGYDTTKYTLFERNLPLEERKPEYERRWKRLAQTIKRFK
jgi:hypothetical protein